MRRVSSQDQNLNVTEISAPSAQPETEEALPETIRNISTNLLTSENQISPLTQPLNVSIPAPSNDLNLDNPHVSEATNVTLIMMSQQLSTPDQPAELDPSQLFKSLDGEKLKKHFDLNVFSKNTESEISGDKFNIPLIKAFRKFDNVKDLGFSNEQEVTEFIIRLRPLIDKDKVQSQDEWKAEIHTILDQVFLKKEGPDFTAMNTNVFEVDVTGKIYTRDKKEWEADRASILNIHSPKEEDNKKKDVSTPDSLTLQNKEKYLTPEKGPNEVTSENPITETLKELHKEEEEAQIKADENLILKHRFEQRIREDKIGP